MLILGLNSGEINSSAVLLLNGKIVAGGPEERFNRNKKTKDFPKNAVRYLFESQNITLNQLDFIAQAWNPGAGWTKFKPSLSLNRIKREDYFYTIPDHLFNFSNRSPKEWVKMEFGGAIPPVYFIQHHRCHIANAFYMSTFREAAFLTADFRGEFECLTKGVGNEAGLDIFDAQEIPDSLGMFYATYTELLGYQPDSDEWKVMALSAYQVDCDGFYKLIKSTVSLSSRGRFELDQSYYQGALSDRPNLFTKKLVELLTNGNTSLIGDENWKIKVAKAMQRVAEEIVLHVLNDLHDQVDTDNLVLSGGFFMNSVINGRLTQKTKFKNLYISYAPDDVGNSIGAALFVQHCILKEPRVFEYRSSSIGPEFSTNSIIKSLERRRISFEIVDKPAEYIARSISDGQIVAVFNGRMEFGDRALGNRSILADPRNALVKDKVNSMIKYREGFRPFAPATLFEKSHIYFDVERGYECNYMEKVVMVREEYRAILPAVTHFDGSGRLQTVKVEHNAYFYRIISEFEKLTGIPIVLNTSFNINGEPIVLSPDDAISTFFNSGLDLLVLENILVKKA